eukprot:scaffold128912_cov18-Tisochrysis_lutea.AAC.1
MRHDPVDRLQVALSACMSVASWEKPGAACGVAEVAMVQNRYVNLGDCHSTKRVLLVGLQLHTGSGQGTRLGWTTFCEVVSSMLHSIFPLSLTRESLKLLESLGVSLACPGDKTVLDMLLSSLTLTERSWLFEHGATSSAEHAAFL